MGPPPCMKQNTKITNKTRQAPLRFNPERWLEFVSFTATVAGAWVLAAALTGGLSYSAARSLPAALRAASWAWLVSMPVAGAQLVLVTALESRALVGTEDFASALPLVAQVCVFAFVCVWGGRRASGGSKAVANN